MVRKKLNVKEVIDGDTFLDSKGRKYRLENVDAPEKGKPGYQKAKNLLKNLIQGEMVGIQPVAKDKYGRNIVRVYKGRKSVNKKMRESLKKKK